MVQSASSQCTTLTRMRNKNDSYIQESRAAAVMVSRPPTTTTTMVAIIIIMCLLLSVISVLHVLLLRFSMDQTLECAEVKGWVFDRETARCLVRLKRTSGSMEIIVSGKTVDELESRAQCTMRVWSRLIDSGCWGEQRGGGLIAGWIERGF
jgi:hypothetical protein